MIEETHIVENKTIWKDEWLEWICGFANAQGGVINIGTAGCRLPDPVFEENCGGVRVTIKRPRNIANLGAVNGDDFGDDFGDEKLVYTVILASPEISQPQIAKITNISARSVSRIVSRLKKYGYIKRHGSDRKGSWVCLK